MDYITHSQQDTLDFGAALGACLKEGDSVLLTGDLGAGKSVLSRGVARALGITGAMPSPSFTILIPYEGTKKLYHFDLYRLSDPDEFYAAGLDEFIGGDGISVIEWPQMGEIEPEPAVDVCIERGNGEEERIITISCRGMNNESAIHAALEKWRIQA